MRLALALTVLVLALEAAPHAKAISRHDSSHQPPFKETNWTCACPGHRDRLFLPGDIADAKKWTAGIKCAGGRCAGKGGCRKTVEIHAHDAFIAAEVHCACDKG